jgi:hypothetical protein
MHNTRPYRKQAEPHQCPAGRWLVLRLAAKVSLHVRPLPRTN